MMSAANAAKGSLLSAAIAYFRSLPVKPNRPIVNSMHRGAAIIVLGLLAASPAFADGFRCGSHLVTEGITRSEVAAKCGEPTEVVTMRSVFRRPVIWTNGRPFFVGEDFVEIPVESWVY